MRAPWTRYAEYTIKYKQVPYDNRYFFVYYGGYSDEIMRIPYTLIHLIEAFAGNVYWNHERSYDRFMYRVGEYNKWLDNQEEQE